MNTTTPLVSFFSIFCILFHPLDFSLLLFSVLHIDLHPLVSGYSWFPRPDSAWLFISRSDNYLLKYVGSLVKISAGKTTVAPPELAPISGHLRVAESLTCSVLVRLSLREGLRKNRSPLCLPKQMKNNQCVRAGEMFSKFIEVTQPERKHLLCLFQSAQKV